MKFNVTIGSPSPLIAAGTLLFNGSAIWLNSVWPTVNVPFVVSLDEQTFAYNRSASSDSLFHVAGLSEEEHQLTVMPAPIISSAVVEMELNADLVLSVDDSQLFSPARADMDSIALTGSWTKDTCLASNRAAGTCHTSSGANSAITYTFEADAITVWGSLENAQARYSVSIDGGTPSYYSGSSFSPFSPSVVIAHASNLGPGKHVIALTSTPLNGVSRLEIDFLQVYTTRAAFYGSVDAHSSSISKGSKIAMIIGSLAGCALIAVSILLFILFRQRQRDRRDRLANASFHNRQTSDSSVVFRKGVDSDLETLASNRTSWSSTKKMLNHPGPAAGHMTSAGAITAFDEPWRTRDPRTSRVDYSNGPSKNPPARFFDRWRRT